jgi:hypothetical protein
MIYLVIPMNNLVIPKSYLVLPMIYRRKIPWKGPNIPHNA